MTDAVGRVALPTAAPGFDSKWVLIGVPVALVVWLALVPLVFLLWQSFLTPQSAAAPAQFTLENFCSAYLNGDNARLFFNSLQFAVGAAVLSLVVGTSLAALLALAILYFLISTVARQFNEPDPAPGYYVDPGGSSSLSRSATTTTTESITSTVPPVTTEINPGDTSTTTTTTR